MYQKAVEDDTLYRHKLRKAISTLAGMTEILVAGIILLAVLISAVLLIFDLVGFGAVRHPPAARHTRPHGVHRP